MCWVSCPRRPRPRPELRVVAYDFGVKRDILRWLYEEGFAVTVVPAATPAAEALAYRPDGIFLSNGPGDPAAVRGVREPVRELAARLPVFGICLGHQILALALGGRTRKLKFGHRGANQPNRDEITRRIRHLRGKPRLRRRPGIAAGGGPGGGGDPTST